MSNAPCSMHIVLYCTVYTLLQLLPLESLQMQIESFRQCITHLLDEGEV